MSHPPQPPYGAPPPYLPPPRPKRRRPSGWWFVVGAVLMVTGIAVGITVIVLTVKGFTETDATIRADGQPVRISVATDRDRMVWNHPGEPDACTIVDVESGAEVTTSGPGASFTKSGGSGSWEGVRTFDPGSGELEITCPETGGEIQVGPAPEFGSFFGGIAAGILIPLLLGGGGFVMLIVVGVLYATGEKRRA